MLKKFKKWFEKEKAPLLSDNSIFFQTVESTVNTNKPSIRWDIDTNTQMGRITVWNSGECQLEILDIESEECVYNKYITLSEKDNFTLRLQEYFEKLIGG